MKNFLTRETIYTFGAVGILVTIFMFAIFFPSQKRCSVQKKRITNARKSITELPVKQAELNGLRRSIEQKQTHFDRIGQMVPANTDLGGVYEMVAELAKSSKLTISQEALQTVEHKSYTVLPFRLNLVGDYHSIVSFLYGLEKRDRLFSIRELTLNCQNERKPELVEGDMIFWVYSRHNDFGDHNDNNDSLAGY